jgi:hypothetical protein
MLAELVCTQDTGISKELAPGPAADRADGSGTHDHEWTKRQSLALLRGHPVYA